MAADLFPNERKYGFGWEIDSFQNKKISGHRARMFGFTSKMIRIPSDDVFIILLNNNSDDPYLETISKKILMSSINASIRYLKSL